MELRICMTTHRRHNDFTSFSAASIYASAGTSEPGLARRASGVRARQGRPRWFTSAIPRTSSGFEVDLIVGQLELAVECKSTREVRTADLKGLRALKDEHVVRRSVVVSRERERRRTDDGIEILPWRELCRELWEGTLLSGECPT